MSQALQRIAAMNFWKSDVDIVPVSGGMTNLNFIVTDRGQKYFVRLGEDIPEHGVMRFNELAASRAAHAVGISPAVIHAESGIMVLQYIEAETLTANDICKAAYLPKIIELMKCCHQKIPNVLRGPALVFWVFQVLRDYHLRLQDEQSAWIGELNDLQAIAVQLEKDLGQIELVFGHNDLLAANFLNDGQRLWLIDWDYAGFNSPLFDLGGLASNNQLSVDEEYELLHLYSGVSPSLQQLKKFSAMKCASLLRELMWAMVSEIYSKIEFDYHQYSCDNFARFKLAWEAHKSRVYQ